jgi:hypothetical protein
MEILAVDFNIMVNDKMVIPYYNRILSSHSQNVRELYDQSDQPDLPDFKRATRGTAGETVPLVRNNESVCLPNP